MESLLPKLDTFVSTNIKYQALVHAEIELRPWGTYGTEESFNSWARMQVISLPDKSLIGESFHNTLMGNSYWHHPALSVAIADGAAGIVGPWRKLVARYVK